MPFGRIFGAMFFFMCSWIGLQFLSSPSTPANVAGGCLILAGVSLGLALLSRNGWARWVGVVAAAGLAGLGLQMTVSGGGTADLLMLFAALVTAVLLAIPATGGTTSRPEASAAGGWGLPGKLLLVTSAVGLVGLMASGVWAYRSRDVSPPTVEPAMPAMLAERVRWSDFGSGLEEARGEGKPLLVNFITTWCGYCKKMDQTTWKHPEVIERVQELVTVRVDLDDTRLRNGYKGNELGARYRVTGTPSTMLIDADGRVLASAGGYQTPRQFLIWLDDSMGKVAGPGLQTPGT